uniref:Site-specific serine recombinase n=1 Tax=Marinitoga okinawensis TaxID=389480 RepID=A0A9C7GWX4_9BACT|nr:recombinase family protein [Marinitoga okinawensis]CAI4093963.1 Site-specific serine recombinase [Marinitoga okinawensis]
MKVVGYVRVSTEEQAKSGLGKEAQIKKIMSYCELYDLELIDIIVDDGVSGKTLKRDGLNKVIHMINEDMVDGIVVAKLDRLTRSVSDMGFLLNKVFKNHELFSVSENVDTRTASGRLVLNVLVSVAQWERETIVERTKDALKAKRDRGEKTGGDIPFGYDILNGKLVSNDNEQKVISYIKRLRNKGYGYKKIANLLNNKGLKTKKGKNFTHMQVKRIIQRELALR